MSKVDQVKDKVTKALDENGDGKLTIEDGIRKAFLLPGMKIDRTNFLTKELSKYYSQDIVQLAIETNPMKAGIDAETINQLADKAINAERNHVAGTTALLATPGGFAMLVTAPADVIQFYGYLLRCIQKLLYLYGFPELRHNEQKILDDSTVNIIVACFGVMSGVAKAKSALVGIAKVLSTDIERTILEFTFAQAAIYPILHSICRWFGIRLSKSLLFNSIKNAIPLVGGIIGGTITFFTFKPCCIRLKNSLMNTTLANPDYKVTEEEQAIFEELINIQ